jgi:hypothetical protein
MSLRIRRGTDAQRQQITPDEGELIFTTNTQKLYMGDGITQGGVNIGQTLAGTGLVFDVITQTLQATGGGNQGGGGILSVSADLNPALGGNLNLNSRNITGTGNIDINGTIKTTGLGANLSLNSFNITGTGNINIAGTLSVTGLGADLSITGRSIIGTGNINTTGTLGVTGLSKDLSLGGYNLTGTGNINTTGAVSVTGAVTSGSLTTLSISTPNGVSAPITCFSLTTNNVAVGTATTPTELRVIGLKDTSLSVTSLSSGTFDGGGLVSFNISSGTHAVPTKIAAEGLTGGFVFNGYNGTTYKTGGAVFAQVATGTDTTGASFIKTNLLFATSNGTSDIDVGLTVRNDKVAESPCFRATPFADATARTAAISSPQAGMVAYLTSTNKLQVYNGTAWVDLH